jgi:hypothetical protein
VKTDAPHQALQVHFDMAAFHIERLRDVRAFKATEGRWPAESYWAARDLQIHFDRAAVILREMQRR